MESIKKEDLIKELLDKKINGGRACTVGEPICNTCLGCVNHCVYCDCCKGGPDDDWGGCRWIDP